MKERGEAGSSKWGFLKLGDVWEVTCHRRWKLK